MLISRRGFRSGHVVTLSGVSCKCASLLVVEYQLIFTPAMRQQLQGHTETATVLASLALFQKPATVCCFLLCDGFVEVRCWVVVG